MNIFHTVVLLSDDESCAIILWVLCRASMTLILFKHDLLFFNPTFGIVVQLFRICCVCYTVLKWVVSRIYNFMPHDVCVGRY
jgi:hypothetical protein